MHIMPTRLRRGWHKPFILNEYTAFTFLPFWSPAPDPLRVFSSAPRLGGERVQRWAFTSGTRFINLICWHHFERHLVCNSPTSVVEFPVRGGESDDPPPHHHYQLQPGTSLTLVLRLVVPVAPALFSAFSPPDEPQSFLPAQKWASKRSWKRLSFWNCKRSNNRKHVVCWCFITYSAIAADI